MTTPARDRVIVVTPRSGDVEGRKDADESKGESKEVAQDAPANAAAQVEQLERTADALRDNLGGLVGELGRRGKHALLPVAAGATALLAVGVAGALLWRHSARRRQKTSRMRRLAGAFRRAVTHPERVAPRQPAGLSKIAIAAAAALASVVARRLAQRWLDRKPSP